MECIRLQDLQCGKVTRNLVGCHHIVMRGLPIVEQGTGRAVQGGSLSLGWVLIPLFSAAILV